VRAARGDHRVEFEGEDWDIGLILPELAMFVGGFEGADYPLADECADAVAASGGDIDAAVADGCTDLDVEQYFPEGSACRACVEGNGGDFQACLDSGECPETAPYVVADDTSGRSVYYHVAVGSMLLCKPDYVVDVQVLTHIGTDGSFPEAFDHSGWGSFCLQFWDDRNESTSVIRVGSSR
jgi:hypothetical protein